MTGPDKSVFHKKFDASEYISTYYPPITDVTRLLHIADLMHQDASGTYHIDAFAEKTGMPLEVIENVAIFDFYRVVVEHLMEEFPSGNALILDIGGGPTVYQHIGLSLVARHITHSEYLEHNRQEVLHWLLEEESAYTWDTYFELVRRLFKYGELPRILESQAARGEIGAVDHALQVQNILNDESLHSFKQHVRKSIGDDVIHADMYCKDLGIKDKEPFDVVTANFVTESAAENLKEWEIGMKNMLAAVGPKGYFIQTAIKNADWYQVGNEKLPAAAVDSERISAMCESEGFCILYQKILEGSNREIVGYDGMVFTLAQRR